MLSKFLVVLGLLVVLLPSGCGKGTSNSSSVSTTPVATPTATLSPTAGFTFAATAAGTTANGQYLSITNSGSASLAITSIAITGANAAQFAQTNTCGSSLATGAQCIVTVTFTPNAYSATFAATLTITDNSGGTAGATQTESLSGTSTAAPAGPLAVLSPSPLTFAATTINTAAGAQTVTLTNSGNATLTGIAISITGSAASSYSFTTTCGTTLAAGLSCSIFVNFTPTATGTLTATLSAIDNATSSPQTVSLSGTGTAAVASLSASSINFSATPLTTTTAAQSVTLTNTGNITLNLASITLGGTNASETTTCGTTLAAGGSCAISATFTPAAATTYSATITLTDNAANSPQVINLSGSGTSSTITRTLYTFPETDNSVTPLYNLINAATKTIDMTMYELQDTVFSGDLVTLCGKGVKVRVILSSSVKSNNAAAYAQLNAAGTNCSAVYSNTAFTNTHQKSFIIDGATVSIMSLNLQTQYYSTTRDFALVENDTNDIAAIQATFNMDYAAGTPSGGTQGASDFNYTPAPGDDLIWSPTTAQAAMLGLINNATTTLLIENEEMSASNIVSALVTACQTRHVTVHIAMVNQSSYAANFTTLKNAGCGVNLYPDTTNGFYIHAKAVVADYGLATQNVYMGSINYSNASMTANRELGLYITDAGIVQQLYTTISADYAGGTPY
jgi:phosphatidylserine/phosphatidylglycerophosphate/cardiolipin synthase-like enzyme